MVSGLQMHRVFLEAEKHPIFFDISAFIGGHVLFGIDGADGAGRNTGPTINALVRMNEKHITSVVDAFYGANFGAGLIFGADAGAGDHMRHADSMHTCPEVDKGIVHAFQRAVACCYRRCQFVHF